MKYSNLPEEKKEMIRKKQREYYANLSEDKKIAKLEKSRQNYAKRKLEKINETLEDKNLERRNINDSICDHVMQPETVTTWEVGSTSSAKETTYVPSCSSHMKKKSAHMMKRFIMDLSIPKEPYILPSCTNCVHCHAKRFPYEVKTFCCYDGEISLVTNITPSELYYLYSSLDKEAIHFRQCIRTYNDTFAFTSIGVNEDRTLSKRNKGIYTFKVQGQIYHFINRIIPEDGNPSHLQLYFYDTDHELENRLHQSSRLKEGVVRRLITILHSNPYSNFFQNLRDLDNFDDVKVIIHSNHTYTVL